MSAPGRSAPQPLPPPPPEDRELSPLTGWTRAHWEWAADTLLAAVRPYANDSGSLIRLPGPASGSGEWSDGLEGYARTFLLAAFRAAHAEPAHAERLLAPYASGLAAGTDPASPAPGERWPRLTEVMQARVEAASIALALHVTRPLLWDRLPAPVRERAVLWLSEMGGVEVPRNNWVWFRAVVAAFLRSVGAPHAAGDIADAVEATEGWYAGGGWYTDGGETNFDHYNGWAMHLYPLFCCRISGDDVGLPARYRERLHAFLDDAQHLVAADGAPLFQGRSLTYRFAAAAPFFTGALFDATPLPPGLTRRAASGMLRHFLDRGAAEEGGLLSLGWHRRFEPMRQIYSGPASPYWASKGFLGLLLPADHPVWTATESELPVDRGDFTRTIAAPGWQVSGTAADGVIRVTTPGTPHGKGYAPLYALPAYTTHTGPDLPAEEEPGDSCVIERRTLHGPWELRTVPAGARVTGHTLADAAPPARHGDGVVRRADGLTSALVPLDAPHGGLSVRRAENANAFGAHSATPVYEGPATTVAVFLGHTTDGTLPDPPSVTGA